MANKVIKSAVWYTASSMLVRATGFITVPIFTRILATEEYGIYSNYASWSMIMAIVVSFNLESTFLSAKKDYPDDLKNYTFSLAMLAMVSAAFWLVVVNAFSFLFEGLFALDIKFINAIIIARLFSPVVSLIQTLERFEYRYKAATAISMLMAISSSLLSVFFAYILPKHLDGAIYGGILPGLLIGGCLLIWLCFAKAKCKIKYWKYALPIALPVIPHALSLILLGSMNRIFIIQYCGAEETALYSIAFSCGQVAMVFFSSVNSAYSPWLGDAITSGAKADIRKNTKLYIIILYLCVVASSLIVPEILWILGGDSYMGAAYIVPPIIAGCVFQIAYTLYVDIEQYEKKTIGMALATVSAAVLNALLDFALIPKLGYVFAGYATAISYGWLLLAHYCLVRKIKLDDVYDNKFTFVSILLTCIVLFSSMLIYEFVVIRYLLLSALVLFVAFFAYRHREQIKAIVR